VVATVTDTAESALTRGEVTRLAVTAVAATPLRTPTFLAAADIAVVEELLEA
jgi:hypothetical protein